MPGVFNVRYSMKGGKSCAIQRNLVELISGSFTHAVVVATTTLKLLSNVRVFHA